MCQVGISDGNRRWVITAYTPAFGSLLLFHRFRLPVRDRRDGGRVDADRRPPDDPAAATAPDGARLPRLGLGAALLTPIKVDSSYVGLIMPAQILPGLGMGTAFMPAMGPATRSVQPQDAGVASAMVSASQQVGGSIGTALLNTVAAGATANWLAAHARPGVDPARLAGEAAVHG